MTPMSDREWAEVFDTPPPSNPEHPPSHLALGEPAADVLRLLAAAENRAGQVLPADRATVARRLSEMLQRLRWSP